MALKITERDVNGVSVVSLEGRIMLGEETGKLREKVKSLLAQGKKDIVLNLAGSSMIDSSGLGALVAAYSSAKEANANLRLSNLGARLNQVLQITKLYTVFEIFDTEEEAVRAAAKKASAG